MKKDVLIDFFSVDESIYSVMSEQVIAEENPGCYPDFRMSFSILIDAYSNIDLLDEKDFEFFCDIKSTLKHKNVDILRMFYHCYYEVENKFDYIKKNMNKELEKVFKKMPYHLFLRSPYWLIISKYKKEKFDNKCQLCNSENNLNTHHNNYKNRGKEYKNLNDLIVLCNKCHKKFHKD